MADFYEVKITRQAGEQLAEIKDYISNELFAPDSAQNLMDRLKKSILSLNEFPDRHPLVEEEPWRTEEIRKFGVNNFLVYYWINREEKVVHIIAIIYSQRDQIEQLKKINKL